jgi:hypothetical protein
VNKGELIEEIAQRTDSSKAQAQRYVDTGAVKLARNPRVRRMILRKAAQRLRRS